MRSITGKGTLPVMMDDQAAMRATQQIPPGPCEFRSADADCLTVDAHRAHLKQVVAGAGESGSAGLRQVLEARLMYQRYISRWAGDRLLLRQVGRWLDRGAAGDRRQLASGDQQDD